MALVQRRLAAGFVCVALTHAAHARAQVKNEDWDGGYSEKARVRSDVVFGISTGAGLGVARGWMNKAAELGRPEFEANTRAALGRMTALWIGGALKDYFVYALGAGGSSVAGNGLSGTGGVFFVRIEAFPLVSLSRPLSDFGAAATLGVGSYTLKDRDRTVAEGGSMSMIGIAVVHETFRWGNFALGPSLEYDRSFSQSMTVDAVSLGVRAAFSTGP